MFFVMLLNTCFVYCKITNNFQTTIRLKSFSLASMEVEVYLNYKIFKVFNFKFIQECLNELKKYLQNSTINMKRIKNSLL